jgi:hypothetical protein
VPAASNPLTTAPVVVGITTVRSTDWCRQLRALPDTEFSTVLDRVAAATALSEQWLAEARKYGACRSARRAIGGHARAGRAGAMVVR